MFRSAQCVAAAIATAACCARAGMEASETRPAAAMAVAANDRICLLKFIVSP